MKLRTLIPVMFLLMVCTLPCAAQTFHDALAEETSGPVKTISTEDAIKQYGSNGKLTFIRSFGKVKGFRLVRDSRGYPTTVTIYDDKDCTELTNVQQFEYDGQGRISSSRFQSEYVKFKDDYVYNNQGLLILKYEYDEEEDGRLSRTFKYSNIKCDAEGNWISRQVEETYADGGRTSIYTEAREITYWDIQLTKEEAATYFDNTTNLDLKALLDKPFAVINQSDLSPKTLISLLKTRPDLFTDPKLDLAPSVGFQCVESNTTLQYEGYPISFAAFRYNEQLKPKSSSLLLQVPGENVANVAKQLAKELKAYGIDMKTEKWRGSYGYQGRYGKHTVTVMYDKKKSWRRSVTLIVTFNEIL